MNRCPICGTTYADSNKFCTKDGSKLVPASGAPAGVGASAAAPPAPAAPAAVAPAKPMTPVAAAPPRPTAAAGRGEPKAVPAQANLAGQILDKRYKIERKLGEGGMSYVYLGTDMGTQA